jgi:hypothetical protein
LTKTTVRRLARAAAALALCASAAASARADAIPQAPHGRPLEYEADENFIANEGLFSPVVETSERWQYVHQLPYKDVMVGSYARVDRCLKVGAFYELQYGARHNDDWAQAIPGGAFGWRNTIGRPESLFILDATPRAQLSFLPGGNWTASLKTRYEYNLYNREETLKLEPELDWFWLDGLTPVATFSLRYQTYLALNFADALVYERWWYAAALWHATPWLSVGPQVGLRDEIWTTSSEFRSANPGARYSVTYKSWVPGLVLVARLP